MDKQRVVITRKVPEPLMSMLDTHFEVALHDSTDRLPPEKLKEFVRGAHAIISIADDKMTGEICDAAGPQLKIIANYAVGYDNVDLGAAIARDIWVTHTPGVENSAVCELTFGLIIALMRGIILGDAQVRAGKFKHWDAFRLVGPELHRATLGIIGLGQIGSTVAERAKGFDMRVVYFDVLRKHKLEEAIGVEYVALEEVFRQADVVTLHVPLTPDTHHLVSQAHLALMKPAAYLLNLCRGPVVDEAALVDALKKHQIAGAGLDVYEHEPRLTPGLAELDNVVLTPHLGSSSAPAREAMGRLVAESVMAALSGHTPRADPAMEAGGRTLEREGNGISPLELQAQAGPRTIRVQGPIDRGRGSIKQHLLDTCMVVEVFDRAEKRDGGARRKVQRWGAVRRQGQSARLGERARPKESRDAGATGSVGLQHVNRPGFQHVAEVPEVIAIFARRDIHSGRSAITDQPESFKVVRRDRLLEPNHPTLPEGAGLGERLLATIGAIRVHVQGRVWPDCLARCLHSAKVGLWVGADLHFYSADPLLYPAA